MSNEHSFPLPEPVIHQLDEAEQKLTHEERTSKTEASQAQPWLGFIWALAAGILLGAYAKSRG